MISLRVFPFLVWADIVYDLLTSNIIPFSNTLSLSSQSLVSNNIYFFFYLFSKEFQVSREREKGI